MGKPLHERIEAFRKHLADVEKSCVATFSNEHVTRARVDAIEADLARIKAHIGLVDLPADVSEVKDVQ